MSLSSFCTFSRTGITWYSCRYAQLSGSFESHTGCRSRSAFQVLAVLKNDPGNNLNEDVKSGRYSALLQSDFPALAWHLSAIPISNESCSTGLAEITKSFSTSTGIPSFRPVAFLLDNSLIDFCDPSTTSSEFRPCLYAVFPECFAGGGAFAPWCIVGREERRLSWRHMVLILERVFKNDKTQDETILHITQLITPTFYNCHQSFGRHWTTQHLVLLSGAQNVPLSSTLAVHSPSWLHRSKSL